VSRQDRENGTVRGDENVVQDCNDECDCPRDVTDSDHWSFPPLPAVPHVDCAGPISMYTRMERISAANPFAPWKALRWQMKLHHG
jgi:hypothetical protein